MKTRKIILTILVCGVLLSCKDESKKDTQENEITAEKIQDTVFTITLNANVRKDDSFQLYFRGADETTFEETKSVFVELKGSENPQDIVFRIPDGAIPDYIRLDFGTNKDQEPIKVNSLKMDYFGKKFVANGPEFFNYLLAEEKTIKFDKVNSTVTPIVVNGKTDPITTSEKAFYDQVQLLVK